MLPYDYLPNKLVFQALYDVYVSIQLHKHAKQHLLLLFFCKLIMNAKYFTDTMFVATNALTQMWSSIKWTTISFLAFTASLCYSYVFRINQGN